MPLLRQADEKKPQASHCKGNWEVIRCPEKSNDTFYHEISPVGRNDTVG